MTFFSGNFPIERLIIHMDSKAMRTDWPALTRERVTHIADKHAALHRQGLPHWPVDKPFAM